MSMAQICDRDRDLPGDPQCTITLVGHKQLRTLEDWDMGAKPRTDDRGGVDCDDSSPLTRPGLAPRRSDTSRLGLLPGVVQQRREQHLGVGVFLTPVEGERSSGG